MPVTITAERPDTADAQALLQKLDAHLAPLYPSESRHGFSVEKLITEDVAFFLLRCDGVPAACGGIKLCGTEYGELKRMYVRPAFRGRGFARLIVDRLTEYARTRGISLLRLETGIHQTAAIRLYGSLGFQRIPPFGDYREDPVSRCYERRLDGGTAAGSGAVTDSGGSDSCSYS